MSINCKIQDQKILVMGYTYPHKEKIKTLGGKFNGSLRLWEILYRDSTWTEVKMLCRSTGGGPLSEDPPGYVDHQTTDTPQTPSHPTQKLSESFHSSTALENKIRSMPKQLQKEAGLVEKNPTLRDRDSQENPQKEPSDFTIQSLLHTIGEKISKTFKGPVWIVGEIQNLNRRGSNIYFSLADAGAVSSEVAAQTVNCQIWSSSLRQIESKHSPDAAKQILTDGMKVRLLATVSLYKARAQISLSVGDIDPQYTKGDIALKREELKRKLLKSGLYDKNKRISMADFPFKIGLLTAPGSRAQSDFLHQLETRGINLEIIFYPINTQGQQVSENVVAGLKALEKMGCNAVVLTRGGGSAADLQWFDAGDVCEAIANFPSPIISAIGHQDDVLLAEEVSFARAKTPTAAAEYILDIFRAGVQRLDEYETKIEGIVSNSLSHMELHSISLARSLEHVSARRLQSVHSRLEQLAFSLSSTSEKQFSQKAQKQKNLEMTLIQMSETFILKNEHLITNFKNQMVRISQEALSRFSSALENYEKKLISKDPSPWLSQGWTRLQVRRSPSSKSGSSNKLTSVSQLNVGDAIKIVLRDGLITAKVDSIEKKSDQ